MSETELRARIQLLEQLLDELEATEIAFKNMAEEHRGGFNAEEDLPAPPRYFH